MESKTPHVIVLTYPAQGHINPLLQFAKRLASQGLKATLATTHYTLTSIQLQAAAAVNIEPISDGFDESGFSQAPSVKSYLDSFKASGSKTLADIIVKYKDSFAPVDCIVYDSLLPWAIDVAREHGVFGAVMMTNSASVCSMYWRINEGLLSLPVKEETMPELLPGLPELGLSDFPNFLVNPESNSAYLAAIMEKFGNLDESDWVFCNSFEELESELVKAMKRLWPLAMVGPLVPFSYLDQQIQEDSSYGADLWQPTTDYYKSWLDTNLENSVIYISFGSMADIPAKQVDEIASALRSSDRPFLWVAKGKESKLPVEFVNWVGETGKGLVVNWCNQLEVLAHRAVGCFVTHCGWNSVLEGLSLAVPMVGVPQGSDQPTNAKFVAEVWGVGVRAKKDEDGVVKGGELVRCVESVMEGERSEDIKKNVVKWRELAKRAVSNGGSSGKNIDEFIEKLMTGRGKKVV